MKLVIQRVSSAQVKARGKVVGKIAGGLFVLLGVGKEDTKEEAKKLSEKLVKLRIMSDAKDKMNLSIREAGGEILVVSQFTLYADTSGGNRPSFINASEPKMAKEFYEYFIGLLRQENINVETGEFGLYMDIEAQLDGPVTILINTNEHQ